METQTPISGWRAFLFTSILTVGLLVLLEVILRLAGLDPRQSLVNPEGPYVRHETRYWALKPGYARQWAGAEVNINDKGLRDEPIDYEKPPGEFRILILGGSVAFGYGVEVASNYASRLEVLLQEELNRTLGNRAPVVRTINSGVGGYSTFQQVLYLKEEGARFSPDLVILDFGLNDVLERYFTIEKYGGTGVFRGGQMTELELTPAKTPLEGVMRWLKRLPKKTAFYALARKIKVYMVAKSRGEKEMQDQVWMARKLIQGESNEKLEQAWRETFAEIDDWARFTRSIGAKPFLLAFPYRIQVDEGKATDRPQQLLGEFCRQHGIPFLDLMDSFGQFPSAELFLDEDHPTVLGHDQAANLLVKQIVSSHLISIDRKNPSH